MPLSFGRLLGGRMGGRRQSLMGAMRRRMAPPSTVPLRTPAPGLWNPEGGAQSYTAPRPTPAAPSLWNPESRTQSYAAPRPAPDAPILWNPQGNTEYGGAPAPRTPPVANTPGTIPDNTRQPYVANTPGIIPEGRPNPVANTPGTIPEEPKPQTSMTDLWDQEMRRSKGAAPPILR